MRTDGIATYDDLISRCVHDEETGCLVWKLACSNGCPTAHLSTLANLGKRTMAARRAAWLLAGKQLHGRQHVYRKASCGNHRCISPQHSTTGGPGDAIRAAGKRGTFSSPERRVQLMASRAPQILPKELVREIAAAIEGGMTAKAAAPAFGVSADTTRRIRRGEHFHQRQRLLPGASVFAMAAGQS